jgi:hypothetical protein
MHTKAKGHIQLTPFRGSSAPKIKSNQKHVSVSLLATHYSRESFSFGFYRQTASIFRSYVGCMDWVVRWYDAGPVSALGRMK